jgi:hypothetical protein
MAQEIVSWYKDQENGSSKKVVIYGVPEKAQPKGQERSTQLKEFHKGHTQIKGCRDSNIQRKVQHRNKNRKTKRRHKTQNKI